MSAKFAVKPPDPVAQRHWNAVGSCLPAKAA
jgi:hypothetical protein